ncbi:MAG: type II CRISPR RNA-guided endonuclease Cas9 [Nitrospira sp.]|nr:type II CRISPR RNA-guided endonuclease Cas9 [Nitrospira sp.]
MMSKVVLGLDLGSNSLGWGLLESDDEGVLQRIIDVGVRIFPKAVEEKTPTPKNQERRIKRLARRTIQRRARRKKKMLNYLVSLKLLPQELLGDESFEGILNGLGDPYDLRAKALDYDLKPYEFGRVLLHLVQRRGFLSNKKTLLGRDMLDDPDVLAILGEEGEFEESDAEESAFKQDISSLREEIKSGGYRTLGEFLASREKHEPKRNRDGQHLRTDRQMYREELVMLFSRQRHVFSQLSPEVEDKIEEIIFHQRPLKLRPDRVGKCKLEPSNKRAAVARLEYQRFRYWQDINSLEFFDPYDEVWKRLTEEDREKLAILFENHAVITFARIRKELGLDRKAEFNLDSGVKKLKGNTTACAIREVYSNWDKLDDVKKLLLTEDLLTIKKKSALKKRLVGHWRLDAETAVKLCMVEFEPDYGSHSLKAINKLLPYLQEGVIYSDARVKAGYGYELEEIEIQDKLGQPPELPNPIVNKALHELKRVVNALIKEYGKPDVIRIEMARDLEMNTDRYKRFVSQQKKNTAANDKAVEAYQQISQEHPRLQLSNYPSREMKLRYRLWQDQDCFCIYSNRAISLKDLFSAEVEVDHILPYSQSLDDSYMNKVVCYAKENQNKGNRTPIDAFSSNREKWEQITQALSRWPKHFSSKRDRFFRRADELMRRDFIESQLTDTRYICKEAHKYLKPLGCDITFTRGVMTSWLRHQWELNDLIGETDQKERTDHRHHTIDAVVTACIDRKLYASLIQQSRELEHSGSALSMKELHFTPEISDIKEQLEKALDDLIVSHVPQRKLTGAFHEETGVGFIDGVGTVYRKRLSPDFKVKNVNSIIDDTVRELVKSHLDMNGNDPKSAFSEGFKLYHRDGKTLIKRVRVVQSKATLNSLDKSKFAVKDKNGKPFKWHAYGNTHHVDVFRHKTKPGTYKADFITAMEMARRFRGVRNTPQQKVINFFGDDWEYLMSLHRNDLVEVKVGGVKQLHRIQKLDMVNSKIATRLHTSALINIESEGMEMSVASLINKHDLRLLRVNAIGKLGE